MSYGEPLASVFRANNKAAEGSERGGKKMRMVNKYMNKPLLLLPFQHYCIIQKAFHITFLSVCLAWMSSALPKDKQLQQTKAESEKNRFASRYAAAIQSFIDLYRERCISAGATVHEEAARCRK